MYAKAIETKAIYQHLKEAIVLLDYTFDIVYFCLGRKTEKPLVVKKRLLFFQSVIF